MENDLSHDDMQQIEAGKQAFYNWVKTGDKKGIHIVGAVASAVLVKAVMEMVYTLDMTHEDYQELCLLCVGNILQGGQVAANIRFGKDLEVAIEGGVLSNAY